MTLADRLQQWWDRIRGHEPPVVAAPRTTSAPQAQDAAADAPPRNAVAEAAPGEPLQLSVEGQPTRTPRRQRRYGEAGFNPYSSTAGYGKRRNWDDVPRK